MCDNNIWPTKDEIANDAYQMLLPSAWRRWPYGKLKTMKEFNEALRKEAWASERVGDNEGVAVWHIRRCKWKSQEEWCRNQSQEESDLAAINKVTPQEESDLASK